MTRAVAYLVSLALLIITTAPAHAGTGRRLLTDMDVHTFVVTSDGKYVVFSHELTSTSSDRLYRLYSVNLRRPQPPRLLTGELAVTHWRMDPDGKSVVVRATGDAEGYQLFSVPVGGGTITQLGYPVPEDKILILRGISQDSEYALFTVTTTTEPPVSDEFFSVPTGGGDAVQLIPDDLALCRFATSSFGSRLVYILGDQRPILPLADAASVTESQFTQSPCDRGSLYSVPLAGGIPVPLHVPVGRFASVVSFRISPDGATVLYAADETVDDLFELYSIPIDGGTPVLLSHPHVLEDAEPGYGAYSITEDSSTAVFRAVRTVVAPEQIYAVPIAGGTPVGLAPQSTDQTLGAVHQTYGRITVRGSNVVYLAAEGRDEDKVDLFAADTRDASTVHLNVLDGNSLPVTFGQHEVSPDGQYVVFYTGPLDNDGMSLYLTSVAGGAPTKLTDGLFDLNNVFGPDSNHVYYSKFTPGCGRTCSALYQKPVTDGAPRLLYLAGLPSYRPISGSDEVVLRDSSGLYITVELPDEAYLPAVAAAGE